MLIERGRIKRALRDWFEGRGFTEVECGALVASPGNEAHLHAFETKLRTTAGEAALPGSVGEYGWAGNAGTLFWIDPKEQLIAIYMVQVSDGDRIMLRNQFRTMLQSAIIN